MTDEEKQAYEVTLRTLREMADDALRIPAGRPFALGYQRAMRDVKAVLGLHGQPASKPVILGAGE